MLPTLALAQTTPATVDDISALKSQLIILLTQEIAVLQGQLDTMLAQEKLNTQAIANLSNPSAPIGGAPSGPITIPVVATLGESSCVIASNGNQNRIPLNVSGGNWLVAKFTTQFYQLQNNAPAKSLPKRDGVVTVTPDNPYLAFAGFSDTYNLIGTIYSDREAQNPVATVSQTITTTDCN